MKFWKTGIVWAWGALLPALGLAQDPWIAPGPGYGAPGSMPAYGYGPPTPEFGNCPPQGNLYQELVPQSRLRFDEDSRCDLTWSEAFSRSYVRLDYLNWRITGGQNALLGAPNSSGADLSGNDPDNMLLASDSTGPRAPVPTSAIVPSLPDQRDTLNGLRGVIGIPTRVGTLEMEAFYFQQLNNGISVVPYTSTNSIGTLTPVIGSTTLFTNGAISNSNMILYSESYRAQEKASFFGSEANWIFEPFTPNVPMTVSPILGFRYINFSDKLNISGTDQSDPTDPTTVLDHYIGSVARNNIFGPQIGLRFSTTAGRFDFGLEPKFIAGINRVTEGVYTRQIYTQTEANRSDTNQRTVFSPIFDLSVNTKLHLSDRFAVYVAYDLLLGGGFSRSYDNIYYNAPAVSTDPSQISLRQNLNSFFAQGFAVGGELTFR